MPGLLPDVDPDGLIEYSVVYTDRAVNHMSLSFREVMIDISDTLKEVYNADGVAVVPEAELSGWAVATIRDRPKRYGYSERLVQLSVDTDP